MANNKVIFGDQTIMDISDTTATAEDVAEGQVFYDKSGNRTVGTGTGGYVFVAEKGVTTFAELKEAINGGKQIWIKDGLTVYTVVSHSATIPDSVHGETLTCPVRAGTSVITYLSYNIMDTDVWTKYEGQYTPPTPTIPVATETISGTVKLNPSENVSLNANGQLDIGGRLGQMAGSTGIYAPKSIQPKAVGDGSLLLTEASGTSVGPKSLAVTTGTNYTVRSASAGATEYRMQNTYENRIKASALRTAGGVLALSEADAKLGNFANVISVKINGADFTPDSSENKTSQEYDIVIKVDKSVNPSSATTTVRAYPADLNFSTVSAGQGVGSNNGNGASVIVGQAVCSYSGNANNIVGASIYNQGNGNTIVGRQHISRKNRWFMAGTGHDNTNGKSESGCAIGDWSLISSDTAFCIGNGTNQTNRSNLFEIKTNGDVYINGVKVLP